MKQTIFFNDEDRIFIGNIYSLEKFEDIYKFLLLEHAVDLFTPKELLKDIKNKLRTETSLVYLTGKDILLYLDNKHDKKQFEKIYGKKYQLYVLYCNPINDIDKFTWNDKQSILNFFKQNPNCPAARFYDSKLSIIVLNSNIISLNDNGNELELQLDHELNHIFDKLSNKQYEDINSNIQHEIIKYFNEYNIVDYDVENADFSIHMFNSSEFYEMLANLCNVISLYFNEFNNIQLYQKLMNMLTHEYITSDEFKCLIELIQGAIIFAYICKKYSPDRWNRTIKAVKSQLQLTEVKSSLQLFTARLKTLIKNLIK